MDASMDASMDATMNISMDTQTLDRCWVDCGLIWGPLFVDFGSTWDRCGIDPGSIRGQFALIRCRLGTFWGFVGKSPLQIK